MDMITPLFRTLSAPRLRQLRNYKEIPDLLQANQLRRVMERLSSTRYGFAHSIYADSGYREFRERVPVVTYEDIAAEIREMLMGGSNILIPGRCLWFSKSSGTTNAKSKYLPVPDDHLRDCHYRGGMDTVRIYLQNNPESNFFSHKGYSLTGSFDEHNFAPDVHTGDLSAILIERMPALGQVVRTPAKELLLLDRWEEKLDRISDALIREDVGNLSGVPSWMLHVVKESMRKANVSVATDMWRNLEVFFHGGIAFDNYRPEYRHILGEGVRYMETYNASEGFFGIQDDPEDRSLLLMLDYGIYYEFIPMSDFNEGSRDAIPLTQVQEGVNYAMVTSTLGGLYRYLIGDTVKFTSTEPYKFIITGRTKAFINAFGEELMVTNADTALAIVGERLGFKVNEYSAGPVFMTDKGQGYHHWVLELEGNAHTPQILAEALDRELRILNSDYDAKRQSDISLQMPVVEVVSPGTFYNWMERHSKLGGQHKVPRLSKDTHIVDQLLEIAKGK